MTYDGPAIFLAPISNSAAQENFQRTVLDGIEVDRQSQFSDVSHTESPVRMWGTKETVKGTWENVSTGDFVLFYNDGTYEYAAEVTATELNEPLGREVWPNHEADAPWVCIIYLADPVELSVASTEIHDLAGYDRSHPLGFSPLNDMGIGGIRGRYGSVESFVHGSDGSTDLDIHATPTFELTTEVLDGLHFPESYTKSGDDLVGQINDALNAGKHIIFTGPPGTGKTEIAKRVASDVVRSVPDVYTGFETTTATADWSTFETVGGYMPTEGDGGNLDFTAGQVLRCFKRKGIQRNDLLIIDEINRSDIDKSFGQLFTLLSGQGVELPFTSGGEEIELVPSSKTTGAPDSNEYVVPASWRLFATMNSYDKASLYEMSYAFMRRFSFIYIEAPSVPEPADEQQRLVSSYAQTWNIDAEGWVERAIGAVWYQLNVAVDERPIGPAIVRDMLAHVTHSGKRNRDALTDAVTSYVYPQLEGVRNRERVITALTRLEYLDADQLGEVATDVLQVRVDE